MSQDDFLDDLPFPDGQEALGAASKSGTRPAAVPQALRPRLAVEPPAAASEPVKPAPAAPNHPKALRATVSPPEGSEVNTPRQHPYLPMKGVRTDGPAARKLRPPPGRAAAVVANPSEPAGPSDAEINMRWDEFLLSLNHATLIAVWELRITSLTAFRKYSKQDLVRPRGRLTEAQANEVESKLKILGVTLAVKSIGTLRRNTAHLTGFRPPTAAPLPSNATSQQKRMHRMANNRLTM